ncbi:MAG TPA: lytic transglycosylase domain-containing protein [Bryobacteraceae bacterium]|nr:lytic transglycosylase domain-containing protein [Bryobacteraceae bacterium]
MQTGPLKFVALSVLACSFAQAAVTVHLRNGTEINARAQTVDGDFISLAVDHGTIEIANSEIASIESIPDEPVIEKVQLDDAISVAEALKRASDAQALPANFVKTVAKVESGLRPDAVSPKGALGLMQLMPETASDLGVKATSTRENALGGAKYLRELLLRYHGDARLALAAYNAGPGAVDRYHGIPPYPETIAYVNKVLREYQRLQKTAAKAK